jgi:hypothetical protein
MNIKTGELQWTREHLAALWEITRRHPDFRSFCERHLIFFLYSRDGLLLEEAHFLPKAAQIRQRFGLNLIYYHNITFTPETIVDSRVFQKPFVTAHIHTVEADDQDALILTPLASERSILVEVRNSGSISLPQVVDEIAEWVRSGREVAGIRAGGPRTKGARENPVIEVLGQNDAWYTLRIDIGPDVSMKQIQNKLRHLAGATGNEGKNRRRGARGSLMASLRFITPETLAVYDLHAAGVGPREIARRIWPDEHTKATMGPEEQIQAGDEMVNRFREMGLSNPEQRASAAMERWPTIERLEARVFEKVTAVKRCISALDTGALNVVTDQSS